MRTLGVAAISLQVLLSSLAVSASPAAGSPVALERRGINPTIAGYAYDGCVGISHPSFGKPLQAGASGGENSMTVEKCAAICWGYTYFGVEYGRECYCGWQVEDGHYVGAETNCNVACGGDSSQNCGGSDWTSMYRRTFDSPEYLPAVPVPSYVDEGCHTEATSGRALSGGEFFSNEMNVETCAIACEGYDYFGLEYHRECYCGNTLNAGSAPALSSECNTPCVGQGGNMCGGNSRLNLYSYATPAASSTISSAPTATPTPPTDLIVDGSFEGPPATPGNPTAWTIVNLPTLSNYSYNFADTSLAYSGSNSLSFGYTADSQVGCFHSPLVMMFLIRQDITLLPDRRYKLSFWSRGSHPGPITGLETYYCRAFFSLRTSSTITQYPLATRWNLENPTWHRTIAYWTNTPGLTTAALHALVWCGVSDIGRAPSPDGIKFHLDVVKFELVPAGQNFIA